jgi:ABC-type transport system involved in cytochrome c biogenesis ATPase subunit
VADAAPGLGTLAGRDRELAVLRRWLAQARAGHGRLVVLAGPPGIGKTRLAEELAGEARRSGQRVLWDVPSRRRVPRRCGHGGGSWPRSALATAPR